LLRESNKGKKLDGFNDDGESWWQETMEGYCSTGQSSQRAVVPVEEEEVCMAL
jgi:hypothetical protein